MASLSVVAWGVSTATFREYEPDQDFLLPPSLAEWLPGRVGTRAAERATKALQKLEGSR